MSLKWTRKKEFLQDSMNLHGLLRDIDKPETPSSYL